MATKGVKQLRGAHITWLTDWILGAKNVPSYRDICDALEARWGIQREPDVIRKRAEVQRALDARKTAEKNKRPSHSKRPTARRMDQLESQVQRLAAEVAALEAERDALVERNLALVNAMKANRIPENKIVRSLSGINRDPTELQTRRSK
jgi:predicted  nucleic acid-binding Zn-ribbon protein